MTSSRGSCQCIYSELVNASDKVTPLRLYKKMWVIRQEGPLWTIKQVLRKLKIIGESNTNAKAARRELRRYHGEVLNLQPGEMVEVKSEREVRETFDRSGRTRGLGFMKEMWKYCGKRFRVHKRLNKIVLESTGEIRKIKNTVLLEDVLCDGSANYDCDRACFHWWREEWLKRAE